MYRWDMEHGTGERLASSKPKHEASRYFLAPKNPWHITMALEDPSLAMNISILNINRIKIGLKWASEATVHQSIYELTVR